MINDEGKSVVDEGILVNKEGIHIDNKGTGSEYGIMYGY